MNTPKNTDVGPERIASEPLIDDHYIPRFRASAWPGPYENAGVDPTPVQVGKIFEDMPLTHRHLLAGLALFMVFVIDSWEMMIIVYSAPLIAKQFALDAVQIGTLIGAIFIGMAVGALIWGPICERVGRKRSIVWSLVTYAILAALSAAAPSFAVLYCLRFLVGVAAAGMLVVTFPLFEELLPVKVRGRYTVYLAAGWPIGMLLALGVTIMLTPFGWRAILVFSALASAWAFVVAAWTPESPYWLVGVGRKEEARDVLERLSCSRVPLPVARALTIERTEKGSTLDIFRGPALRITVLQIAVNFSFSWGYWGLQTWLPTLLQQRGLDLPQSYGFIALSAVCMIPGYLAASWLTGRFGRKRVVIAFIVASALAGYGFANASDLPSLYAFNFLLAFFSLGAWGVWDTWMGELYPTRIRVIGYSWGVMAQRVANTLAPSVVGILIARSSSFNVTATFIDAFLVATAILATFLPETEGRDLD